MVLNKLLKSGISKQARDQVIEWVGSDEIRMCKLMDAFFSKKKQRAQHAAWVVGEIARYKPHMVSPYIAKMYQNLSNPVHDAVKRSTLRAFQTIAIPEEIEGPLFEWCFSCLNDTREPIALRVFSMDILADIASRYADLRHEVVELIQMHFEEGTAGYKSAAKRNLKKLKFER